MKFIDDKNKTVRWYNRNYFYAGTILLILVNVILFWQLGNGWCFKLYDANANWGDFRFINFLNIAFTSLSHSSWEHVLGNIINLLVVGLYLERKYGTFNFLFLNVLLIFTVGALASHVFGNVNHHGYSGVNWALYGIIITDYIFSFKKERRNLTNIILGAVVLVYIYLFSMCYGGNAFIDVTYYPANLIHNMGHWSALFWGLLFGLFYQLNITYFINAKKKKE